MIVRPVAAAAVGEIVAAVDEVETVVVVAAAVATATGTNTRRMIRDG